MMKTNQDEEELKRIIVLEEKVRLSKEGLKKDENEDVITFWGIDDDDARQQRKDAKTKKIHEDAMRVIEFQDELIFHLKTRQKK